MGPPAAPCCRSEPNTGRGIKRPTLSTGTTCSVTVGDSPATMQHVRSCYEIVMEVGLVVVHVVVSGRLAAHGAQQLAGRCLVPHGNVDNPRTGGLRPR